MVSDNHFAKLVAIAKIDIKSKRRHTLFDVGNLGGLTDGLTDAGADFRWEPGRRDDAKPVRGVKSWHAAFVDRRHLLQHPVSWLRRHGQHLHLSLRAAR